MMTKKYDVIIVGAGPAGIFCAYELVKSGKKLNILMLEKGRGIARLEQIADEDFIRRVEKCLSEEDINYGLGAIKGGNSRTAQTIKSSLDDLSRLNLFSGISLFPSAYYLIWLADFT